MCMCVYERARERNICKISQFEESYKRRNKHENEIKLRKSAHSYSSIAYNIVSEYVCWAHIFYGSKPNRRINQITNRNRATTITITTATVVATAAKNGTSSLSILIMSMVHTSSRSTNENNTSKDGELESEWVSECTKQRQNKKQQQKESGSIIVTATAALCRCHHYQSECSFTLTTVQSDRKRFHTCFLLFILLEQKRKQKK